MWLMVVGAVLVCGQPYAGQVDTVGGTTYDWWCVGPRSASLVNSPDYGLHVTWMYSAELSTSFTDRNMRYNFYDYATSGWNWIDPDFMQSGVNVFAEKSGYGNLGADPTTGCAIISRHSGSPTHPGVARDIAPGAGIFEYADGTPIADGYQLPPIAVGQGGVIHQLGITTASGLGYTRVALWPDYEPVVNGFEPGTVYPSHAIAASKVSPKVFVCWSDNGDPVSRAYWRLSEDGGVTWGTGTELVAPPAFGTDTTTSFHITSLFPFYDQQDRIHVVASVIPVIRDTAFILPAEIWHWMDGTWTEIHRADCAPEHLLGDVGTNATYADRPTMGEDPSGNLFVAWEQFDSSNVEPVNGLLRAGVWLCASTDNGATWSPGYKATPRDAHSYRFPCVVDWNTFSPAIAVTYLMDLTAGFGVMGQHPLDNNYVICHFWEWAPAIQDWRTPRLDAGFRMWPNPAGRELNISGGQRLVLLDVAGRERANLHEGTNNIGALPPGVYVVRDEATRLSRKLVVRP